MASSAQSDVAPGRQPRHSRRASSLVVSSPASLAAEIAATSCSALKRWSPPEQRQEQHRRRPRLRARGGDGDGQHFQALIVSPQFAGKSRMQRHQLVYAALGDRMREEIHALSMQTLTPEEWPSVPDGQAAHHAAAGRSTARCEISGAKNAALPILCAALLTAQPLRAVQRAAACRTCAPWRSCCAQMGVAVERRRRDASRCTPSAINEPTAPLRAGEDHARLGAGAGAAARALRPGQGVAAGRLRHRPAAGRPAHQGPAGDGRDDRDRARLHARRRRSACAARAS